MADIDALLKAVKQYMYPDKTKRVVDVLAGESGAKKVFGKVREIHKNRIKKNQLLDIVPKDIFRPKVRIFVDFAHIFTDSSSNIKGSRIVDTRVLQQAGNKIFDFSQSYFQHQDILGIKISGKIQNGGKIKMYGLQDRPITEDEWIIYINKVLNYLLTAVSVTRARRAIGTAEVTIKGIKNNDDKLFSVNPGKVDYIFNEKKHPYFKVEKRFKPMLKDNFGFKTPEK